VAFASFQLVAKSLRVNYLGLTLVASISSIVAVNATVLTQVFNDLARLVVIPSAFFFAFLPTTIIIIEIMTRSHRNVTVFETLGAQRRTVTTALLLGLVVVGLVGATAGALFGLLLTNVYAGLSPASTAAFRASGAVQVLFGAVFVIISCVGGIAAGVLFGVRVSWSKLS
jgi:predicted lysophospholipase L1 biosynthesis ABC-type transport system permease subunit